MPEEPESIALSTRFYLTKACDQRCFHCADSRLYSSDNTEFSLAALEDFLDHVAPQFEVPTFMMMTGGEPALAEGFSEALEAIDSSFVNLKLATTGHPFLQRPALWETLEEYPPDQLVISVDGPPERHDTLRNRDGAYSDVERFLEQLRKRRIRSAVAFNVVIDGESLEHAESHLKRVAELRPAEIRIYRYRQRVSDSEAPGGLRPVDDDVWERFASDLPPLPVPAKCYDPRAIMTEEVPDGLARVELQPPHFIRVRGNDTAHALVMESLSACAVLTLNNELVPLLGV